MIHIALITHTLIEHFHTIDEKKFSWKYLIFFVLLIPVFVIFLIDNDLEIFLYSSGRILSYVGASLLSLYLLLKLENKRWNIVFTILREFTLLFLLIGITDTFEYTVFQEDITYLLRLAALVLYISYSGTLFITNIIKYIYREVDDLPEKLYQLNETKGKEDFRNVSVGKYVGILERFIITLVLLNQYLAGIAFIFAIKSLVRFKALENKIFSEYYLLGTFLSISYAISIYYVLDSVL